MVGAEFLGLVNSQKVVQFLGVEDFADKMSFMYSVLVFLFCGILITAKQYLNLDSIFCYIPTTPSGENFDGFLTNYCWVHGTIPILKGEKIPSNTTEWEEMDKMHRITYYQWVPFMLGLQCILFYLPRVVWQIICYNRTGTDLEHLMKVAKDASDEVDDARKKFVRHVAATMEEMLFQHREYRSGRVANARKRAFKFCGIFIASKRLGTMLICTYLIVKCVYLANAIGQLYLMQTFLGFNSSMSSFGYQILHYMVNGVNWRQTRIFPRVTFCYLDDVRHLGTINQYVTQCVLPINMLNEKLYIFLWFWTVLVVLFTAVSIPVWVMRVGREKNRSHFIKKFLRLQEIYTDEDQEILHNFITDFLRHDGVFLLRMLSMNAGDVAAGDVVVQLWDIYRTKYKNRSLLNNIAKDIFSRKNMLEGGGEVGRRGSPTKSADV